MHWQHQPGGPDLDLLCSIPARHLHYIQVCDAEGPAPDPKDYVATAIRSRPLPGDGEVDIAAVISALDRVGADPFFAMEVFNSGLAARGPEFMARRVRAWQPTGSSGEPTDMTVFSCPEMRSDDSYASKSLGGQPRPSVMRAIEMGLPVGQSVEPKAGQMPRSDSPTTIDASDIAFVAAALPGVVSAGVVDQSYIAHIQAAVTSSTNSTSDMCP